MSVDQIGGTAGRVADVARWAHQWQPRTGAPPRGTLAVIPGRGERGGVYRRLGERLAADGYVVRAVDGLSEAHDLDAELLSALDGPGPVVLLGSDTGALWALALADRLRAHGVPLAGVVAAGVPARGDGLLIEVSWAAELDARTACPTHRGRLNDDLTLRRGEVLDPDVAAPAWAALDAAGATTDVPVLFVHGRADLLSPVEPVAALTRRLPRARLVTVAGGRHDVLNDVQHRSVAAQVVTFLERLRLGADLPEIIRVEEGSSW
ncbi:alpha/beta hydrolase [Luedemannella helvata]|uniref:Alpha/beta fold hydrolase n=1 Tax=Luedemannella helvata TaxID=349315 RepID=A0ABN2JZG7_9ACTN